MFSFSLSSLPSCMTLNVFLSSLHLFHTPIFICFVPAYHFHLSHQQTLIRPLYRNPNTSRPTTAHHLSPQALKWREYRRRNPLGVERVSGCHASAGLGLRPARRNVFDFPSVPSGHKLGRLNGAQKSLGTVETCKNIKYLNNRLRYFKYWQY